MTMAYIVYLFRLGGWLLRWLLAEI